MSTEKEAKAILDEYLDKKDPWTSVTSMELTTVTVLEISNIYIYVCMHVRLYV